MSILNQKQFHNEKAAYAYVEARVWPTGPVCPHCGNYGKIYDLKGVRSKPSKKNPEGVEYLGLKKCAECRKPFTVKVGTIFEDSHIKLHIWLQAIFLIASSKKGISANQLHRTLGITLKSAWFLGHRIREAMKSNSTRRLGGAGQMVEVDETYLGRRAGTKKNMEPGHKAVVVSLIERGGEVHSAHVHDARAMSIEPVLMAKMSRKATLMTDEASVYKNLGKRFQGGHVTVNHSAEEYVRGEAHTNTVESYFSVFKRGMKGTYQRVSEKHLKRYVAEFDFRHNNRTALGVNDTVRADRLLANVSGRRLTYRTTH